MKKVILLGATLTLCISLLCSCSYLSKYDIFFDSEVQENAFFQGTENIGSSVIEQLPDTEEAEEEKEPELTKDNLVGTWSSARREPTTLYFHSLTFYEDGTVANYGYELNHAKYSPFMNETGWYTAPMGFPGEYGTYTLEGSKLTITYTHADYGAYDEPYVDTLTVSLEDGKLITNNYYGTYIPFEEGTDKFALCDALGIDYSVD